MFAYFFLLLFFFFFFNETATTEIYTLSLHDALPICSAPPASTGASRSTSCPGSLRRSCCTSWRTTSVTRSPPRCRRWTRRSEEHTSELQSRRDLVCRLLLEKKKKKNKTTNTHTKYQR